MAARLVWDVKADQAGYESMMSKAFEEARRVMKPDGVFVCVYAHQTTAGWATLIGAVRLAGFSVVEAWPLNTEMPTRGRAQDLRALSVLQIFLLLYRALKSVPVTGHMRSDRNCRTVVWGRVEELPSLGITGTDLGYFSRGAGLARLHEVLSGREAEWRGTPPGEYLEEVEREVSEAVLARIFGTDRGGLGRVDQKTQFYVMGRFEFGTAEVPWDELNTLARGVGVELADLARGELVCGRFPWQAR